MSEPPAKRARRTDSAAMWERDHPRSPRSPRHSDSRRDDKEHTRHEDDRAGRSRHHDDRRRSRSPRDTRPKDRDRSRSRERSYRDRDRERDKYREREVNGHDRRDRDRERHDDRGLDYKSTKSGRDRSRSPDRNERGRSARASPPRGSRTDHDRQRGKDRDPVLKPESVEKPKVNGDVKMDLDEDDEDARLRRIMGFTTFKTTQNMKVPGNQIYGVRKEKKTVYRQYMNRVGGFNRPLSPGH